MVDNVSLLGLIFLAVFLKWLLAPIDNIEVKIEHCQDIPLSNNLVAPLNIIGKDDSIMLINVLISSVIPTIKYWDTRLDLALSRAHLLPGNLKSVVYYFNSPNVNPTSTQRVDHRNMGPATTDCQGCILLFPLQHSRQKSWDWKLYQLYDQSSTFTILSPFFLLVRCGRKSSP